MNMSRITLPQANSIEKVMDVVSFVYHNPKSSIEDIAEYIGFTVRQALYYRDAARYFGLIDGQMSPTSKCADIMSNGGIHFTEGFYECVIKDELFGAVFTKYALFPECDIDKYALDVASIYYPDLATSSTLARRSHAMVLWAKKILHNIVSKQIIK